MDNNEFILLAATKRKKNQITFIDLEEEWLGLSDGDEFLIGTGLTIYGGSFEYDESIDHYHKMEQLVSEEKASRYCSFSGYIIHAEEALNFNYEPYDVCDAYSSDLEYVYSVFQEYELEVDIEKWTVRNILYIDTINWNEQLDLNTRRKIANNLKGFIYELYHVRIDALVFYTAPTEDYTRTSKFTPEREQALNEKLTSVFQEVEQEENVVHLGKYLNFTEEEINQRLGRRNSGEHYPREFINQEEYTSFIELGFREIDETRLLYKFV